MRMLAPPFQPVKQRPARQCIDTLVFLSLSMGIVGRSVTLAMMIVPALTERRIEPLRIVMFELLEKIIDIP